MPSPRSIFPCTTASAAASTTAALATCALALAFLSAASAADGLVNLSTRAAVTADAPLISGFVIAPGTDRTVLIRAAGPALAAFGVTGTLADPVLTLYRDGTAVASNDNWLATDAATIAAAGAFAFSTDSKDAALVTTLAPGAYTAQVAGNLSSANAAGLVLLEVYDATALAPATAATGEAILHPASTKTYNITDSGRTVAVPAGMIYLPAATFTMGSGTTAHSVSLDAYCIGKFAVTHAQYKIFLDATGRAAPRGSQESTYGAYWSGTNYPAGKAAAPVAWIKYSDALAYCAWVSAQTGRTVTLPTEAQWEHAARGPANTTYPWGNASGDATTCNYRQVCMNELGLTTWFEGSAHYYTITNAQGGYTKPVGSYARDLSGYGCYDLGGNLATWCSDWFVENYFTAASTANPVGPTTGTARVTRGGSWYDVMSGCSSVQRDSRSPELAAPTIGFRLVLRL